MKNFIVATDFSPAAQEAINYAAGLARTINASVLVMHFYQMPILMNETPIILVSADELKKTADTGLARAVEDARKTFADVAFETESRLGDVATELEAICEEKNPIAIIVGTKQQSGFDRFLFGDVSTSLAKNLNYPLIIVPEGAASAPPKNIAFATDLSPLEETTIKNITELITPFTAMLHAVHIQTEDEQPLADEVMQSLKNLNPFYHSIKEDDITEGLQQFIFENKIDMLLLLPHKHSLMERWFTKGHTEDIVHHISIPMLIVH